MSRSGTDRDYVKNGIKFSKITKRMFVGASIIAVLHRGFKMGCKAAETLATSSAHLA
ncbi:hypothetical protein KIN20_017072 [Parelaphostrongylus tenuis]|uniref:Uncharacterized protein n=1 Tax=Parelaphostrongylus tenuis TaxID=148309 RepID=A0AAD5QR75_PARTN|nr:hypothetical protein KIN20_017072 [Parelaphostrongylus tenuis]